jgi:NADPH-dependent curcumin reductase CurA
MSLLILQTMQSNSHVLVTTAAGGIGACGGGIIVFMFFRS